MTEVLSKVESNLIIEVNSTDKSEKKDHFFVVILDKPGRKVDIEEYEGKDLVVSELNNPIAKILGLRKEEEVEINGSKFRVTRIVRRYRKN